MIGRYEVLVSTDKGLKYERYGKREDARQDFDRVIATGRTPGGHQVTEAWLFDRKPPADAQTDTLAYWDGEKTVEPSRPEASKVPEDIDRAWAERAASKGFRDPRSGI
jgi:hypothetical protein